MLLEFYRELLRLRRETPALALLDKRSTTVATLQHEKTLLVIRRSGASEILAVFNFDARPVQLSLPLLAGQWQKQLDSGEQRWEGEGSEVPDSIDPRVGVKFSVSASAFCLFSTSHEQ